MTHNLRKAVEEVIFPIHSHDFPASNCGYCKRKVNEILALLSPAPSRCKHGVDGNDCFKCYPAPSGEHICCFKHGEYQCGCGKINHDKCKTPSGEAKEAPKEVLRGQVCATGDKGFSHDAELLGALARGYCHPSNSKKVLDYDLIIAMACEIEALEVWVRRSK